MTITLQAVNELIASLESAGELSIKETKVMALAKAYQQLAAENAHLKSRMQRLICIIRNADNDYCMCGDLMKSHVTGGCGCPTGMFDYHYDKWLEEEAATPATDRIVAGIKADWVEAFAAYCGEENSVFVEAMAYYRSLPDAAYEFAKHLREGADK
ncbi:hypothetical protein ACSJG6_18425 [Klebsiella pneumoniae]|uniref:hypothetical protein n=1 Tax=Klebsiella pneumoniae TaxID=573 RepID=UPI00192B0566|nr:hypothetical protein [Klebsiella pneumoniae]EKV7326422.1 hypothetical protein [Klebsiella pneumoniae]ELA0580666.1 hypothetical protein [Klebsiella pneumoniae]MBL4499691.1 hypothetical protein [Klebsiella pneumoniae]MBL4520028.1 hypothetical protein [Klebsiella pneumoniae]MDE4838687.1 hypothetical protein [Klebsiella pneumoniae]